jgi:hypothetical protein
MIEEFPTDGDLVLRIYSEESSIVLGDRELGSLPGSVAQVLGAENRRGIVSAVSNALVEERRIGVAGRVTGAGAIRVRIK